MSNYISVNILIKNGFYNYYQNMFLLPTIHKDLSDADIENKFARQTIRLLPYSAIKLISSNANLINPHIKR